MKAKKIPAKLDYNSWVAKYFEKEPGGHISIYEKVEIGFAPCDLSRYKEKDLKDEYTHYLNDTNTFIKYEECTNKLIEEDEDY